jgi:hypothetical protein
MLFYKNLPETLPENLPEKLTSYQKRPGEQKNLNHFFILRFFQLGYMVLYIMV